MGSTNLAFKVDATVKESFDSNIYLQDNAPNPANVAAARAAGFNPVSANQESMVTTILPRFGVDYKPSGVFNLSAGYAPEIAFYHSAHSEDYMTHRGSLTVSGAEAKTSWELLNTVCFIDGSTEGPTFARPDDIPAIGGIPLRERRRAFTFRNYTKLTQQIGAWFIRPVAATYFHDFQTEQKFVPPAIRTTQYSYENYIDRRDLSGGIDVGYEITKGTRLVVGFRYGRQEQGTAPSTTTGAIVDSPFGNNYQRYLVGVEGSPARWLKVAALFGPDVRQFDPGTPPTFDRNQLLYYWDVSATLLPTTNDTVTLSTRSYEQPAFSSFSMYEDCKTDIAWRHKFNNTFSAQVGFTLHIGDWQKPVNRDDWIYTPNVSLTCAFTKRFSGEVAYSYDWVQSKVPAGVEPLTDSHEFTRHIVSVGLKYTF